MEVAAGWFDRTLWSAYFEKFGQPIPIGPWHGAAVIKRGLREARRAVAGDRGALREAEFPMYCPPGAIL